jgi:hypothetical protein
MSLKRGANSQETPRVTSSSLASHIIISKFVHSCLNKLGRDISAMAALLFLVAIITDIIFQFTSKILKIRRFGRINTNVSPTNKSMR